MGHRSLVVAMAQGVLPEMHATRSRSRALRPVLPI